MCRKIDHIAGIQAEVASESKNEFFSLNSAELGTAEKQIQCTFIDLDEYCQCDGKSIIWILFKWSIAGLVLLLSFVSLLYLFFHIFAKFRRSLPKNNGNFTRNLGQHTNGKIVKNRATYKQLDVAFQDTSPKSDGCSALMTNGALSNIKPDEKIFSEIYANTSHRIIVNNVDIFVTFSRDAIKNFAVETKIQPVMIHEEAASKLNFIEHKKSANFAEKEDFAEKQKQSKNLTGNVDFAEIHNFQQTGLECSPLHDENRQIPMPNEENAANFLEIKSDQVVHVKISCKNLNFQNLKAQCCVICDQLEKCQKNCTAQYVSKKFRFESNGENSHLLDTTQRESFDLSIFLHDKITTNREGGVEIILKSISHDLSEKYHLNVENSEQKCKFLHKNQGKNSNDKEASDQPPIGIKFEADQQESSNQSNPAYKIEQEAEIFSKSENNDLSEFDGDNTTAPEMETVFEADEIDELEDDICKELLFDGEVEVEATVFLRPKFERHHENGSKTSQCEINVVHGDEERVCSPIFSIAQVLSLLKAGLYDLLPSHLGTLEAVGAIMQEAGLESSNLIFGIDYTASNKYQGEQCFGGKSLHHIENGLMNPYQKVITIFGQTLAPFAKNGSYLTAFGFGDAATTDESVFLLKSGVFCSSFQEILDLYNDVTPQIILGGPTNFAPLIYEAMHLCKKARNYHILAIVADGQVTNERATRRAIVDACHYPISIIVVGVGDGPWDMMRVFDDSLPKRPWDNFHFVEFNELARQPDLVNFESIFAAQSLLEIPDQYKTIKKLGLLDFDQNGSKSDSSYVEKIERRSSRNRKNCPQFM